MADEKGKTWYGEIDATITDTIKENRKRDITAVKLQGVLLDIVKLLKGKWLFGGVVQPSSQVDITGDVPTFYIAFTKGTYTNFGNNEVADGEFALFMPNLNGNWDVHKWSIGALLDGKVNVKEGYDLSKNDYTDEDRDKVASLPDNVAGKSGDTFPEGNFASFDENGNVVNSGCNEGTFIKGVKKNGEDLTPDANGKVNVEVQDGKSAYQLYVNEYMEAHGGSTEGMLKEDEWLDSLDAYGVYVKETTDNPIKTRGEWLEYIRGKSAREIYNATYNEQLTDAQFAAELKMNYPMLHVGYNSANAGATIGVPFDGNLDPTGDDIAAGETTMGKLYLMPDDDLDPENCIGFVTVLVGQTHKWCNVGAIRIPSDVLAKSDVDNECTNGTVNTPASANVVMGLKAKLGSVTASETKGSTTLDYNGYIVCKATSSFVEKTYVYHSDVHTVFIPIPQNAKKIRFLGRFAHNNTVTTGYAFINAENQQDIEDNIIVRSGESAKDISAYIVALYPWVNNGTVYNTEIPDVVIPDGATYFCAVYGTGSITQSNFYCYLKSGETAITDSDIDKHYEKQVKITDTDIIASYLVESCVIDATTGTWLIGQSQSSIHTKINIEGVEMFEAKGTAGGAGFAFLAKNNKPVDGEFSGAILLSNGTYRQNLSANEVATIIPPSNAKYLIVMRGISSAISTPVFLKFFYKKQLVGTLNDVTIPIELHAGRLSSTTGLIQEISGTTTASSDIMFRNYAYEKLIAFNPLYESIVSTDYNGAGTITYHCFAENGNAYLGATTNKDAMPVGTTHIRIGLGGFNSDQADKIIRFNLYCKLKDKEYHILKSGGNQYFPTYNPYHRTFSFEVTKPHIFDADSENTTDYYADGVDSNGNLQRDWTQGVIILPKDYSNVGKPSKVIINCHGTTSFNFDKTSFDMDGAWGFLAKCGYVVIDCCTDTFYTNRTFNSGDVARASNYPTGNAWECYSELVKFVLDNFNVDPNAFYIAGKSAGGMNAISFANKFSNIKINAIGLMAPGIDVWMNMRVMYASGNNDFLAKIGCENPQTKWGLGGGGGVGSAAAAQKTYVLQYKDLINLHNPLMTHISENFDKDFWVNELLDKGMFASRESGDTTPLDTNSELIAMVGESSIYMKSPLKIWHAIDDAAVPYTESKWFVQMCKNGGCYALLRTWPSGNGRHYFDSFVEHEDGGGSIYTPQLVSYTTKFNEIVQANPAYCELVDWFNRW